MGWLDKLLVKIKRSQYTGAISKLYHIVSAIGTVIFLYYQVCSDDTLLMHECFSAGWILQ